MTVDAEGVMLARMDDPDESWGRRLRQWRRDHMNWSQDELVERIVHLAFETNEERGTALGVRLVGRWESGRVQRPQGVYRRLLAQLGAPLPTGAESTGHANEVRLIAPGTPDKEAGGSPVHRRDFLRAGSALAIPGLVDALANGGGRTITEALEEMRHRLAILRKLDATLGGGDTYRLYTAEVEVTGHLLRGATRRDAVKRELLSLYAEQTQQAGWAAFDAGWHDLARDHYRSSHAAATEADDAGLAGNALAFHAYQLIRLGLPARTTSEKSVRAADRPGVDPGVRALLHSRAAWTFALDGDLDATTRCLGRAEDALALADGWTPDYAAWIDETELAIMAGRCWSELRRPLRAVPLLERALAGYSDTHARDKALYSSWLADSYIDAGEIEQAAMVAQSSLTVMGDTSSVRPRERLMHVADRLADHRDLPVVRDFLGSHALHPFDVRR